MEKLTHLRLGEKFYKVSGLLQCGNNPSYFEITWSYFSSHIVLAALKEYEHQKRIQGELWFSLRPRDSASKRNLSLAVLSALSKLEGVKLDHRGSEAMLRNLEPGVRQFVKNNLPYLF